MNSNFYLKTRLHQNDLYIYLHGTFNGSSACELAQELKKHQHHSRTVFIDTTHITSIFSIGKDVLNAKLPGNRSRNRLHFKGIHAKQIAPDGCVLLKGPAEKTGHVCTGSCKNCKCRGSEFKTPVLC